MPRAVRVKDTGAPSSATTCAGSGALRTSTVPARVDRSSASVSLPGGQDLRAQIYAWPDGSACEVDKLIVSEGYQTPGFPNDQNRRRTLTALEYLFFHSGSDNQCSPSALINGSNANLSFEGNPERIYGLAVTPSLFSLLQTQPTLGRRFP